VTDSLIESENNFSELVISWYEANKRTLPWREEATPYHVWLSEIILQQTRVAQGLPYYHNFVETFPSVHDLAYASEDEVLRLWEGLGYYSRARNLHATAKMIVEKYDGKFPDNYAELIKLKGVGPYTAAAIASICFDESVPVIDGNVYRLIARAFGIYDNIADTKSRKVFEKVLNEVVPRRFAGAFNQGMMELGALVCKPANPACDECPLTGMCFAFEKKVQVQLPVKIKKQKIKKRDFTYHVWTYGEQVAMRKRPAGDIWQGLYDFHLEESTSTAMVAEMGYETVDVSKKFTHVLSHQRIEAVFYRHEVDSEYEFRQLAENHNLSVYSKEEIVTLPKPKLIVNYLNESTF
jgi:A/G-specific adenine glycosylase